MFKPERLRIARIERGFSQEDLVIELSRNGLRISRQTVFNFETGATRPDADVLATISFCLNKPITYFFDKNNNHTGKVN